MKKIVLIISALTLFAACCRPAAQTINVVPYPNEVHLSSGTFDAAGADFHIDAATDAQTKDLIGRFASQLSLTSGKESAVTEEKGGFNFIYDGDMPSEAYRLKVSGKDVKVYASALNGFNYAIQTIKQMLPVEIFGKVAAADKEWMLPCCRINDEPRFRYRGMHMDVSRHFFDMDEVKRYLDIMEVHKLNTLHWHLTDDQGWRLEIKKYPRLTEVGSIRKGTLVGHLFESTEYDGIPYGEGCFFTQDQVKEILAYAAAKGITIVPEIDLPGHMLAALSAYPELGCTGGPYDVWGRWGIADDVLCVGKKETMRFLEDILTEVCELFPSEYIHIGGDECPKVRWETCAHCQTKIKELGLKDDDRFTAEHYLQGYVTNRMGSFLAEKGKKIIGWDEILEGKIAPEATVMSWRGVEGGQQAAKLGHDAIMTPNTFFYLDFYQSLDKENEPLAIGGFLPAEKCYSFEPCSPDMTEEEKAHIIGVQANLWTEYIATPDHLHYMLLPHLAALSEVQWCQPQTKSWKRFHDSADEFCAIYDIMGYKYADHIFDTKGDVRINREKACVEVMLDAQGETDIRYTLDGSDPTQDSPLYTEPVEITGSGTLKARSERNGTPGRIYEKTFSAHKAMGRPAQTLTQAHANYTYNSPDLLTDGVTGKGPYNSGDYAGWNVNPFEVLIDMGEATYSEVTLSTFVFRYDYVFGPMDLAVCTSEDGKEFTEAVRKNFEIIGRMDDGNGCNSYTISFPETSARYLKVTARAIDALPDWHDGRGRPGFLFIDEVIVK